MKTKRQEKRDERAKAKERRRKNRCDREAFRAAAHRKKPDSPGPNGLRWMPVPETEYECNQFGNIRKRLI